MIRHFVMLHKPLMQHIVRLLFMSCLLTAITTPGGNATKPVPKEPPWPLNCQLDTSGTPCGLLY